MSTSWKFDQYIPISRVAPDQEDLFFFIILLFYFAIYQEEFS